MGAATAGAAGLDAAFITQAFGAQSVVKTVPISDVQALVDKTLHPEQFGIIERSLAQEGLKRIDELAKAYQVVARSANAVKTIAIVPYHPSSRKAEVVGSIGISERSAVSGVSVRLRGTQVVSYTTHDVFTGKLVRRTFTPDQLAKGVDSYVERDVPREKTVPDVTVQTSQDLSIQTFQSLLSYEQNKGIYSPAQVRGFLTNTASMRLVAQLQFARHQGVMMSPGHSCCCCCCCCWGSCSSCSAVSSSYLSERYQSRAASRRISV